MAEFQWWLLLVGLVAGGGLVAMVTMDSRRRDEDIADAERRAESTWIADRLASRSPSLDPDTVDQVLRVHREYLSLPAPDRLLIDGRPYHLDGRPMADPVAAPGAWSDGDADDVADDVGDDRGSGADQHLPGA